MSAREVIRLIEALPPDERSEVFDFVKNFEAASPHTVRYMDQEKADAVSARVFEEHSELFRKLAQ